MVYKWQIDPVETPRYALVADRHLLADLGRGERLADAYARSEPAWEARPTHACGGSGVNGWPG